MANDLPSSHAAAIETLRNFIAAMEAWEREALRIDKEEIESGLISVDAAFEKKQRALRDVYLEYCVADAQPARLQRGSMHYGGRQPTYSKEGEVVEEVKEITDGIQIRTLQSDRRPADRVIYELEETADGWRIRDSRRRVRPDGSLTSWNL